MKNPIPKNVYNFFFQKMPIHLVNLWILFKKLEISKRIVSSFSEDTPVVPPALLFEGGDSKMQIGIVKMPS